MDESNSERVDLEIGDRFFGTMPWSEVCLHMQVADRVMEVEVREHGAQLLKDGQPFSFPITWGEAGIYTDWATRKPYTYNAEMTARVPRVHRFSTTWDAYNASQCLEEIQHGDVLVAADDKVIGFLDEAWPLALTAEHGEFHGSGYTPGHESRLLKFQATYQRAQTVAAEMGIEITVPMPAGPVEDPNSQKNEEK